MSTMIWEDVCKVSPISVSNLLRVSTRVTILDSLYVSIISVFLGFVTIRKDKMQKETLVVSINNFVIIFTLT